MQMLPHLCRGEWHETARRTCVIKLILAFAILAALELTFSYWKLSDSSIRVSIGHGRKQAPDGTDNTWLQMWRDGDGYYEQHYHATWQPSHSLIARMAYLAQNEDLELRGKWQMAQIENYCKKYGLENQYHVLPMTTEEGRRILFRHLLSDSKRNLTYSFLPKAGCTNLRRLFFAMQGEIPADSTKWMKVSETQYLRPAIARTSLQNSNLTEKMRLYRLKNYFKFVMIRNPLERLVSAYRNKIELPLQFIPYDLGPGPLVTNLTEVKNTLEFFQALRRFILSKYNPRALIEWAKTNGSLQININFSTYVRWIIETKDLELNEHFSSLLWNAAPCRVGYNLYLNFKNYTRDVRLLISTLKLDSDLFVGHSSHVHGEVETRYTLPHYYSQLSTKLKRRLFVHRRRELDFYYYLYPEEQLSHVKLLGVEDPVGLPEEYWPYESGHLFTNRLY